MSLSKTGDWIGTFMQGSWGGGWKRATTGKAMSWGSCLAWGVRGTHSAGAGRKWAELGLGLGGGRAGQTWVGHCWAGVSWVWAG